MASSSVAGDTYAGSSSGPRLVTYAQNSRTASVGEGASMGSATLTSQRAGGATGCVSATGPSDHGRGGALAGAARPGQGDEAAGQMVVDHAGRLHERVGGGRADEPEASLLQLLGHRDRLR